MSNIPRFAVVGHPNKGKSSIVSTLTHDDGLAISELSGTTTKAQSYPFQIENSAIYELFDTPGFQRPRQVLSWIKKHASDASTRINAVTAFIQCFSNVSGDDRFTDEVELLTPIMKQGAGIIYVVDGSISYTPEYEAEMTILQWTGQPRMALINPIGGENFIEQWQQALGQYFSIVKVFNPMSADIEKQISVLSAFSELNQQWQSSLIAGIAHIRQSHANRIHQALTILVDVLSEILSHKETLPLLTQDQKTALENTVKEKYQHYLKNKERELQQRIATLYAHPRLKCNQNDFEAEYPDLFDQGYWFLFGLDRQKIMTLSVGAGAAAGALLDASVGGASLLAGTVLGGVLAGTASFALTQQPDKVSLKGFSLGGKLLTAGPVRNMSFAFVLLGRNIKHLQAVSKRVHADRSILNLIHDDSPSWIEELSQSQQISLTRLLQKSAKGLSDTDKKKMIDLLKIIILDKK